MSTNKSLMAAIALAMSMTAFASSLAMAQSITGAASAAIVGGAAAASDGCLTDDTIVQISTGASCQCFYSIISNTVSGEITSSNVDYCYGTNCPPGALVYNSCVEAYGAIITNADDTAKEFNCPAPTDKSGGCPLNSSNTPYPYPNTQCAYDRTC